MIPITKAHHSVYIWSSHDGYNKVFAMILASYSVFKAHDTIGERSLTVINEVLYSQGTLPPSF